MVITTTHWVAASGMLYTRISGHAGSEDVTRWQQSIEAAVQQIPGGSDFRIVVDLHGFKAVNFQVHQQFRVIIPSMLMRFGWKVGYLDMFPEAEIRLTNERKIQCQAAAHVHHDENKIALYENQYSRGNERFFTDPVKARQWIMSIKK